MSMLSTKAYLSVIFGLCLPFCGYANSTSAVDNSMTKDLVEVGRGEMDWLWFNLYKARLMTPTGQYRQGEYPQLLDIEYYRDIDAADLLQATAEQWRHLGYAESDISNWLNLLKGIWPNVAPGDHLSFKLIDSNQSQFYVNQQPLSLIQDPQFAQAFLAIWLSTKTSRPSLRAQLLGEKSCDC